MNLENQGPTAAPVQPPYIKFTKVKDKITYVERLENKDFGGGSITYWGELIIVLR